MVACVRQLIGALLDLGECPRVHCDLLATYKDVLIEVGSEMDRQFSYSPSSIELGDTFGKFVMGCHGDSAASTTACCERTKGSCFDLDESIIACLQWQFPGSSLPLLQLSTKNYGFIDELAVPSSGLTLTVKTFKGLHDLMWQLDMHYLQRQYVVVCCGLATSLLPHLGRRNIPNQEHGTRCNCCISPQISSSVQAHLAFKWAASCRTQLSNENAQDVTQDSYTFCALTINESHVRCHSLVGSAFARTEVTFQPLH